MALFLCLKFTEQLTRMKTVISELYFLGATALEAASVSLPFLQWLQPFPVSCWLFSLILVVVVNFSWDSPSMSLWMGGPGLSECGPALESRTRYSISCPDTVRPGSCLSAQLGREPTCPCGMVNIMLISSFWLLSVFCYSRSSQLLCSDIAGCTWSSLKGRFQGADKWV